MSDTDRGGLLDLTHAWECASLPPVPTDKDILEAREERAAIMQYHGEMPLVEAEKRARGLYPEIPQKAV